MQAYLLALSFLTCLPIKINYIATREQLTKSLTYYPWVGFTLGGIIAGVASLGDYLGLGLAGNALTVITLVVLTAGLHLDGLMDTADGLLSGRPRERKLEIMKDSSVGAMGAIVLVCQLILKITLVAALVWSAKYRILILMPAVGRWVMVYAIAHYPYAGAKPGLGSVFDREKARAKFWWASLFLSLAAGILIGLDAILALVITLILVYLLAQRVAKSLGGQTGDTYGATGELAELVFLLTMVLLNSLGTGVGFGWRY